jgi:hypothetical protein
VGRRWCLKAVKAEFTLVFKVEKKPLCLFIVKAIFGRLRSVCSTRISVTRPIGCTMRRDPVLVGIQRG